MKRVKPVEHVKPMELGQQSSGCAGIKQIAAELGVSIGTVDRALHGRSGISVQTRELVLRKAEQLQYRPNVAARRLKLNRRLRIAVHLPREIASFFDLLRAGVRAAAAEVTGAHVDLDFRTPMRLGNGDVKLLEDDLAAGYDGVLLTPGDPRQVNPVLQRFHRQGTPVVCVASDAPGSQRLAAVQIHGQASGAIAAEMLANSIAAEGAVAVIAGSLATLDHAEKWKGFANALALIAPHLRLLPAIETHEQPTEAAAAAIRLACGKPGQSATLKGIYLATANSLPVLRALEERSLLPKIRVVATDLFPELESYVASGKVLATLDQRPFDQGKRAFELLMSYVLEGKQPEPETRFIPHLVLRGNLPFYVQGKIGANVCSKISVDISEATTLK